VRRVIIAAVVVLSLIGLGVAYVSQKQSNTVTYLYTYRIVNAYPHDKTAFTQGLAFENGMIYEGTGLYGHSSLRETDLETGKVLNVRELPSEIFGEGITICGNRLVQITWKNHLGFVYDKETFDMIGEFSYLTEGWGITFDGIRLIMSDGSSTLYFLDAETLKETGRIEVQGNGAPVTSLNELEYIRGEIYANVWMTNRIAIISPETGRVVGWIDLEGLLSPEQQKDADVLNGIAYDRVDDRIFVTGKLWPTLFEIDLVPSAANNADTVSEFRIETAPVLRKPF
jgi:glutamine cyclotransferase